MDRIVYEVGAEELGYVWTGRGRAAEWVEIDLGEVEEIPVTLRIVDMFTKKGEVCGQKGDVVKKKGIDDRNQDLWNHPTREMVEIVLQKILDRMRMKRERVHTLYLIDEMNGWQREIDLIVLLNLLLKDLNQFIIVTARPEVYEQLLDEVFWETGLIGNCVEHLKEVSGRNFIQSNRGNQNFYDNAEVSEINEGKNGNGGIKGKTLILDFSKKESVYVHAFPKNSIYLDIYSKKAMAYFLQVKRADIIYESFAKFLDSRVKNRYNTLVNEGIVNHEEEMDNRAADFMQKLLNKFMNICKTKGKKR